MRNLKKFLALVLAMMMTLSLMVTVNAAPATPNDFTDKDEITAEYKEAVNVLSALGIVKGDERGFRPSATINRAEVATMIYRIATNVKDSQADIYKDYGHFTDVDSSFWAAGYINYCANAELIKGRGGDKFDPKSDITGYELLAMLLRLLGYDQKGEFTGKGWETRTASFGQEVGITKGITALLIRVRPEAVGIHDVPQGVHVFFRLVYHERVGVDGQLPGVHLPDAPDVEDVQGRDQPRPLHRQFIVDGGGKLVLVDYPADQPVVDELLELLAQHLFRHGQHL